MASAYGKKDIMEEMDMFCKERDMVAPGSVSTNKAVGKASAMPVPVALLAQPIAMVVETTTPGTGPGKPTISEELA